MKRQKMTGYKWFGMPAVMGLATGLMGANLQAQPGADPKGDNPPIPQQGGGNRPNWRNMTPAQREQQAALQRERTLRRTLNQGGFTDKVLQDTILAFAKDQDKAGQLLRDQPRKINEALQNEATTDQQLAALLADFRADIAAEKDRREAALTVLDQKIGYTKKPRLDALLMTMGLTGDEMSLAGGVGGPGMGGPGGRGGGGGGFGGGFGGGGGQPAGNPPAKQ